MNQLEARVGQPVLVDRVDCFGKRGNMTPMSEDGITHFGDANDNEIGEKS
ncbi:MAG TPA: hypothetical protein VKH45_09020 [Candidatus Acidoferrum sp.]|nr:hypothetical protein [Candidatus Acidoferrum sp.]